LFACGNGGPPTAQGPAPTPATPHVATSPAQPVPPPPPVACEPGVPAAACQLGAQRVCKAGDTDRIGEWRYAIAAPPYTAIETQTLDEIKAMWRGDAKQKLAASVEIQATLAALLGPGKLDDTATWKLVPAHELSPRWKAIAVDGKHPLDKESNALAVPLCGTAKTAVRNIDPKQLTALAMTGTTALTRGTSKLMELKGITYPLRDVQSWFAGMDVVHISNEVSVMPDCKTGNGTDRTLFCEKESYLELLDKAGTKVIELSGSHLDDFGHKWIPYTVELYNKRGWVWFGGGPSEHQNTEPKVVEHNGNKLVFIGCNWFHTKNPGWIKDQPGVAACDVPRIAYWINDYKRRGHVVIISIQHFETNNYVPGTELIQDLRELASYGPAFVMGSQAHCPHPWEIHHGTPVHYGPGNLFFDQDMHPLRDSAQNKLYIHAGKLLSIGHLFARIEEKGRPRPMTDAERTTFLAALEGAQKRLPKGAKPDAEPIDVPASRKRPESFLIRGVLHHVTVEVPAKLEPGKTYPAFLHLTGDGKPDDAALVVTRVTGKRRGPENSEAILLAEITDLLKARYPVDTLKISVVRP
jgi:hypothetical protein